MYRGVQYSRPTPLDRAGLGCDVATFIYPRDVTSVMKLDADTRGGTAHSNETSEEAPGLL